MPVPREEALLLGQDEAVRLRSMKPHELRLEAKAWGVTEGELSKMESDLPESNTILQHKESFIVMIAKAPIKVEMSICQQGLRSITIAARCLRDGDKSHRALCVRQLSVFEEQINAVLEEKWPGCSATVRGDFEDEEPAPEPELWHPGHFNTNDEPEPELEPSYGSQVPEGVPPQLLTNGDGGE